MADVLFIAVPVLLGASLVAGRLVGRGLVGGLRAAPGRGREVMPGLPGHDDATRGRAAVRFERAVERTLAKLLRLPERELDALEAGALAARFGEPPEVVAAALDDLAARTEHRLRVTSRGRLLYGFTPAALTAARRARRAQLPTRLAFLALGLLGNLGAAWPLLATLGLGAAAVAAGLEDVENFFWLVVGALIAVALVFGATAAASVVIRWLLDPRREGPTLSRLHAASSESGDDAATNVVQVVLGGAARLARGVDDFRGVLVLMVIALFLAVLLGALVGVGLWLRGVIRAVVRRDERHLEHAPSDWVRAPVPPDPMERFVPSHDIALGLLDAVTSAARRRRPLDPTLPDRVVARARAQGGHLSALDLALAEGYDLDEAIALLAQLSGRAGGDVLVSEAGDLDFTWPAEVLAGRGPATAPPTPGFEALDPLPPARRQAGRWTLLAEDGAVRINVPGLTWAHLRAGDHLAAGTLMLGLAVWGLLPSDEPVTFALVALAGAPIALAWGATSLSGAARRVARVCAAQGVLRDVRRAAAQEVAHRLRAGAAAFASAPLVAELHGVLASAWPSLTEADVAAEVEAVALDLGLELDLDATATAGGPVFSLAPLRDRLAALEALRAEERPTSDASIEADAVVFDTAA